MCCLVHKADLGTVRVGITIDYSSKVSRLLAYLLHRMTLCAAVCWSPARHWHQLAHARLLL